MLMARLQVSLPAHDERVTLRSSALAPLRPIGHRTSQDRAFEWLPVSKPRDQRRGGSSDPPRLCVGSAATSGRGADRGAKRGAAAQYDQDVAADQADAAGRLTVAPCWCLRRPPVPPCSASLGRSPPRRRPCAGPLRDRHPDRTHPQPAAPPAPLGRLTPVEFELTFTPQPDTKTPPRRHDQ
jgi:hypothetical protein